MDNLSPILEQLKEKTCSVCQGRRWLPLSDDPAVIGVTPCSGCNASGKMMDSHLTRRDSGEHWSTSNPGLSDQYRAEAKSCREALGFDPDSKDVSPADLRSAIERLKAEARNR